MSVRGSTGSVMARGRVGSWIMAALMTATNVVTNVNALTLKKHMRASFDQPPPLEPRAKAKRAHIAEEESASLTARNPVIPT